MSLLASSQSLSADFVELKARVKAEMTRRKYVGSLTAYAGTDQDYTVEPAQGGQMLTEHVNKIVTPLNQIADTTVTEKSKGEQAVSIAVAEAKLTANEGMPYYGSGTDCASSCTGLCSTGCSGTCSGCTGCSGSCRGGCYTGCSGCSGCGDACSSGCSGGCTGCGSGCNAGCSPTCAGGCWNDGCTLCTGCGGVCSSGCTNACAASCANQCAGTVS